jgi:hypothetical protein
VIRRGHHPSGQLRLDLLNEGPQVSLSGRIFLQQVRQPRRPLRRQDSLRILQIRPAYRRELAASLVEPPLRDLDPVGIAATQQPCDPVAGVLPRIGDRCCHHGVAGQRCQRHQAVR